MKAKALKEIFDFSINSSDFNGISLTSLSEKLEIDYLELLPVIKELIIEGVVSIQSDINPHIIHSGHYETNVQLEYLKSAEKNEVKSLSKVFANDRESEFPKINFVTESHLCCAYPTPTYLKQHRNVSTFENAPFTKRLALAEAQLSPVFFELDVLERYFTNPLYDFSFEDYSGKISIFETQEQKSLLKEADQVFLQDFGLGFDSDKNRVVVVYLCYLNDLTAEHQVYWKTKEVNTPCKMVVEYYQNTILGEWSFGNSVFSAFIEEQRIVNEMSKLITGKNLFRETYEEGKRPKEFTFFTSPTLLNYDGFTLLFDKMLSENINKDFFKGEVELYELEPISEGVKERKQKGTLKLLEEWLRKNYRLVNEEGYEALFTPFKKLRSERQKPAHKISENYYDKIFFKNQMDLLKEVYFSMNGLRHMLQQHPLAKDFEIPDWIKDGNIKEF